MVVSESRPSISFAVNDWQVTLRSTVAVSQAEHASVARDDYIQYNAFRGPTTISTTDKIPSRITRNS
jgi:hypothetical protein